MTDLFNTPLMDGETEYRNNVARRTTEQLHARVLGLTELLENDPDDRVLISHLAIVRELLASR